jgi:hypothetical protein
MGTGLGLGVGVYLGERRWCGEEAEGGGRLLFISASWVAFLYIYLYS